MARKKTEMAVVGLGCVIISQWIGYGLLFDGNFFLRNLSVAGGLLMLLADAYSSRRKQLFAGLPSMNESDRSTYLQLFGRILLVGLFLTFVFSGEFSVLRMIVAVIGLFGCVMVVIGFKAKYTSYFLIAMLSVSNAILNNWWTLHHNHPKR
jgi:ER-derived vesicles protein